MSRGAALSRDLIAVFWAIWIVGWMLAAIGTKRTQWREHRATAIYNRAPTLLGVFVLLFPGSLPAILTDRLLPLGPALPAIGTVLVLLGLLFAGWARWHLGRNWSGIVALKHEHTLTTSGPYRWVRHPIYSGLLAALLGTALATGAAYGFIALALILIGFLVRVRFEEMLMRETFPADYDAYSRHTARLVPGVF